MIGGRGQGQGLQCPAGGRRQSDARSAQWPHVRIPRARIRCSAVCSAASAIAGIQSQPHHLHDQALRAQWPGDGRHFLDARISEPAARECDLLAFQLAIERGHPGSVMCAYNRVNGPYACDNDWLLNKVLKKRLGLPGLRDVRLGRGAVARHRAARTRPAVRRAARSARCSSATSWRSPRPNRSGLRGPTQGHEPAHSLRHLCAMAWTSIRRSEATGSLRQVTRWRNRRRGKASSCCAMSADVLPLTATGEADRGHRRLRRQRRAFGRWIQPGADGRRARSGPADRRRRRCQPGLPSVHPARRHPRQAAAAPMWSTATAPTSPTPSRRPGRRTSPSCLPPSGRRRARTCRICRCPNGQDALIAAVAKANPSTIVVLETGSAVLMPWLEDTAAVVEAWYPGGRGGRRLRRCCSATPIPAAACRSRSQPAWTSCRVPGSMARHRRAQHGRQGQAGPDVDGELRHRRRRRGIPLVCPAGAEAAVPVWLRA